MLLFHITCNGCDFSQEMAPFGGYFGYWSDETAMVTMRYSRVWCRTCQSVSLGEVLRDAAQVKEALAATKNRHDRRDLQNYLDLLERRQAPPRCLRCGGTELSFESPDGKWDHLVHPDCGGVLTLTAERYSPSRADLPIPSRDDTLLYSFEGEYLSTLDYPALPRDWRRPRVKDADLP